jgi:hypothetical protein
MSRETRPSNNNLKFYLHLDLIPNEFINVNKYRLDVFDSLNKFDKIFNKINLLLIMISLQLYQVNPLRSLLIKRLLIILKMLQFLILLDLIIILILSLINLMIYLFMLQDGR